MIPGSRAPALPRTVYGSKFGLHMDVETVRTSDHIVPVSDFKAEAADWLRRIGEDGQPLVITQNGRAAGVLLSPAAYDALTERARFVGAVEAGLREAEEGKTKPHAEVVARMKKRFRHGAK
jgi:prevent-host-death family protein